MVTKTYKQNANSAHNHSDSVVTPLIGSRSRYTCHEYYSLVEIITIAQ